MQAGDFHDQIETEGIRLLTVAAAAGLTRPVPTCPGWSVGDAVEHTAEVYEHKLACMALSGERPQSWPPPWPPGRDPLAWFADAHQRLLVQLRSVDPAMPSWTWWPPDQTAGFWSRRMAHETAIHRADVESAVGGVTEVNAELAADGVEEILTMMLAGDWSDEPQPGSIGTVRVGRWRVAMTPTEVRVDSRGGPTDVHVSGTSSTLDLWLWGRVPDEHVHIAGDAAVAARFRARAARATQ